MNAIVLNLDGVPNVSLGLPFSPWTSFNLKFFITSYVASVTFTNGSKPQGNIYLHLLVYSEATQLRKGQR